MKQKFTSIFLLFCIGSFLPEGVVGHQQVFSVLPNGALGVTGQQQFLSTLSNGQQVLVQQQPSLLQIQILRQQQQPLGINLGQGGLTQLLGQPGYQFVGGQNTYPSTLAQLLGNVGVNQPLILNANGLGLSGATSTLPYPLSLGGLTAANINGVPVLVSSSGLGLNGLQTSGLQTIPLQTQLVQQPVVGLTNPVLRQVGEEDELVAAAQMDPLDAALLDMENQGQMHMEKYAWGRSGITSKLPLNAPNAATAMSSDATKEQRSNVPLYYTTLPKVGGILSPPPPARVRSPSNPFVDGQGKRKKHFELYQYFRNLDLNNPQQVLVPLGSGTISSTSAGTGYPSIPLTLRPE